MRDLVQEVGLIQLWEELGKEGLNRELELTVTRLSLRGATNTLPPSSHEVELMGLCTWEILPAGP